MIVFVALFCCLGLFCRFVLVSSLTVVVVGGYGFGVGVDCWLLFVLFGLG